MRVRGEGGGVEGEGGGGRGNSRGLVDKGMPHKALTICPATTGAMTLLSPGPSDANHTPT